MLSWPVRLGPRRLGHSQNPSPQDPTQFSDRLQGVPESQLGLPFQYSLLAAIPKLFSTRWKAKNTLVTMKASIPTDQLVNPYCSAAFAHG
jgi:hypothetical protein